MQNFKLYFRKHLNKLDACEYHCTRLRKNVEEKGMLHFVIEIAQVCMTFQGKNSDIILDSDRKWNNKQERLGNNLYETIKANTLSTRAKVAGT